MHAHVEGLKSVVCPVKCNTYPRIGHKCIQVGRHIFVFGGVNHYSDYLNSVLRISCESHHIKIITTANSLPIDGFSLFPFRGTIYIWGGSGPSSTTNNLWSFHYAEFKQVIQTGKIPHPRCYHSSVFISHQYFLVYGGIYYNIVLNDWALLDCNKMEWRNITTNISLPISIHSAMVWECGQGFLLQSYQIDLATSKHIYCTAVYRLRLSNDNMSKLTITAINVDPKCSLASPRGSSTLSFIQLYSPYLVLLGGELTNEKYVYFCSDMCLFNLYTLYWLPANNVKLNCALGCAVATYHEKMYLIGGADTSKSLCNTLEIIDFDYDMIESKACQRCRDIYGQKVDSRDNLKPLMIKYEHVPRRKYFFSQKIVHYICRITPNPISAFGLLIDNSFNFCATMIKITLETAKPQVNNGTRPLYYPEKYLSIYDNSYGFTKYYILDSLYSFSCKMETTTHDTKYYYYLSIRKYYGVNLKLSVLRLGLTCLFVMTTIDRETVVVYFTVKNPYQPFKIIHYVTKDKYVSSYLNRIHIFNYMDSYMPPYAIYKTSSKQTCSIYIFGLTKYLSFLNGVTTYPVSSVSHVLSSYFKCLYLYPYLGRIITINHQNLHFVNLLERFRNDYKNSKLQRIDIGQTNNYFRKFLVFRVLGEDYDFDYIIIYHSNRMIKTIKLDQSVCGVVEVHSSVQIDLCKTRLINGIDDDQLHKLIAGIVRKSYNEIKTAIYCNDLDNNSTEIPVKKIKADYIV